MTAPLLEVAGLVVTFAGRAGPMRAVDGVSFSIGRGETLAVVGESGSGKSVTALAVLRLIPDPPGRIAAGTVRFDGADLLALPEREMRRLRGNRIAMVFQDPMTSLNPVLTIGAQIAEALRLHQGLARPAARARALEMLELVEIAEARARLDHYPHELSGGMRQRVMIAMALACAPELLIADEPTTALDVTIQAQILDLLRDLRVRLGTAVLLITHDLGVVREFADRVAVFYAGRKVEEGPTRGLITAPRHPYTMGLLAATPRAGGPGARGGRLAEIPGAAPALSVDGAPGCAFAPRCPLAIDRCRTETPALTDQGPGRLAACHRAGEPAFGAAP